VVAGDYYPDLSSIENSEEPDDTHKLLPDRHF